jgi:hypothetical protein
MDTILKSVHETTACANGIITSLTGNRYRFVKDGKVPTESESLDLNRRRLP